MLKVCGGVGGGEKRYDIRSDRRRLRRKEAIKKEGKRLRERPPSLPPSANPPHAILRARILGKVSRLPLLLRQ